jgi:RNA polymerase sigma factor (sigma-70 family)
MNMVCKFIDPPVIVETLTKKTVNDYYDLIESIARIEYKRLSYPIHLADYTELVNIGAIAVHVILTAQKNAENNISYFSTAIKWAIRNELRRRYKWHTHKFTSQKDDFIEEGPADNEFDEITPVKVREKIYEAILSIENMEEYDVPYQIKDSSCSPDEGLELRELMTAVKESLKFIPAREKAILDSRFFKNKKIKEIADELHISPSRVSRIIQSGLDRIKEYLKRQDLV